jgi:homopolymeric O-antigen transport system ATP-binding protein
VTPIIRVERLGKRYRIGQRAPYRTLRESVMNSLRAPLRYFGSRGTHAPRPGVTVNGAGVKPPADADHIWALSGLSFDVMPGEVLGVIGRNGAGKSTLLKILSRITEPTTGRVELYGRVASLLEVGTGFHPELTGGENIYLSGAILGMRRNEIRCKFDEMVAFAELENFVDTPVKHYSSGMYVRLAFAVAAHLEPEILLVDEVLAVGDIAFQKKCLGKMGDVAKRGRTVLFVSHNMASIEGLCGSCLLLSDGEIAAQGAPRQVLAQYVAANLEAPVARRSLIRHPGRTQHSLPIMTSVALLSGVEPVTGPLRMGSPLSVKVEFSSKSDPIRPVLGLVVKTATAMPVFTVNNRFIGGYDFDKSVGSGTMTCTVDKPPLMPGTYVIDLYFGNRYHDVDIVFEAASFEIVPADVFGTGHLPPAWAGPIFCPATWKLEPGDAE